MREVQRWQQAWSAMGRELQLHEQTPLFSSELHNADSKTSEDGSSDTTPLAPVLRSKGLIWTDTQVDVAAEWSQAGRCIRVQIRGEWSEETEAVHEVDASWPPRSELVFIGA